MADTGDEPRTELDPELRATLCGLVAETRRGGRITLLGIVGDDGVQVGKAKALDRELNALEQQGYVRVVDGGAEKTIEVRQKAIDECLSSIEFSRSPEPPPGSPR